MKKIFIFAVVSLLIVSIVPEANATSLWKIRKSFHKNIKVSDGIFTMNLPKDMKGKFTVKKRSNGIYVYDKISKKAKYGGFVYGVQAYKNPKDHAMMPGGRKIGELIKKKGDIYDVVLIHPTDVQYDYKNGASESYNRLYNWSFSPEKDIQGIRGAKYVDKGGMLGKDLYQDILKKHLAAIEEKWDSAKLEKEDMSYMYNVARATGKNPADIIGYAYYDANSDGIDELLIGEIAEGGFKGVIYDIYTMVDRKPEHVISGGARNRFYVCDGSFLCNEASSGADESYWLVYILVENSTELFPQVGFKYDGYKDKKKPWYISYDFANNKWESVTEEVFKERKNVFENYERLEFIPLSTLKQ